MSRSLFVPTFVLAVGASLSPSTAGVLSPQTQTLLLNAPGTKAAFRNDRLVAIYGAPVEERDQQASTAAFVADFLDDQKAALGIENAADITLVAENDLVIGQGKFHVFYYSQQIVSEDNLKVYGSLVTVLVLLGSPDKVVDVGINLVEPPAAALPADVASTPSTPSRPYMAPSLSPPRSR